MNRKSVDEIMMQAALLFAERSTCIRIKAGSVIAVDNHIVSTGYNGSAPGQPHCCDHFEETFDKIKLAPYTDEDGEFKLWLQSNSFKNLHREFSLRYELHGEANAIIFAARRGVEIEGGTLYTTFSPCLFCAKSIIAAGLSKVVYHELYDREEGHLALELLKENDIAIDQI
jgi:dCMP deaminase